MVYSKKISIQELLAKISLQKKNVSGWMGSCQSKIADYIKRYSPPEVALMIFLFGLLIFVFSQILQEYLEELARKKYLQDLKKK